MAKRDLPGFGVVSLAAEVDAAASPPAAVIVLKDPNGRVVYRFPGPPGSEEYAFHRVAEAEFKDLDGDGQDDVVAVIEYMTGIGPSAAEPFPLAAIYLRRGPAFEIDQPSVKKIVSRTNAGRVMAMRTRKVRIKTRLFEFFQF